jgi:hypothetical protein
MAAESQRDRRSSPSVPNPREAWVAALIFLAFAVPALLVGLVGIVGFIMSILDGTLGRDFDGVLGLFIFGGLFSAFLLYGAWQFLAMAKRDRRAWRLAAGRCPRCGYDIHHLPEPRCPECGETWSDDEVGKRA